MTFPSITLVACIGSCLMHLPVQALPVSASAPEVLPEQLPTELTTPQLQKLSQSITVKVLSGDTWGSGILIQKQGQVYTVLTNQHVLTPGEGKPYRIQTADGRIYPADSVKAVRWKGNDLGLLQFSSANNSYPVASLETSSKLTVGDAVFASGFPFETDASTPVPSVTKGGLSGFVFTTGQISLVLDKAFNGGYQIGYTNNIQKGMSGGPLLNRWGKVVGINGIHSYPIWGNPYAFKDGSVATPAMQEELSRYSWAVPVQTFLQLAPRFATGEVGRVIIDPKLPDILPLPRLLW